eukprot:Skav230907  [mRNA]  locus=scaffold2979:16624:20594:+ [translate_table: standard]
MDTPPKLLESQAQTQTFTALWQVYHSKLALQGLTSTWCLALLGRCADAKALPSSVAPVACVLRLGNSSDDLHAFDAAARTWGVKCRWFLGLASKAERFRRIVNGSRARVLEAVAGPSSFEVYTPPIAKTQGCADAAEILVGDYIAAKLKAPSVLQSDVLME